MTSPAGDQLVALFGNLGGVFVAAAREAAEAATVQVVEKVRGVLEEFRAQQPPIGPAPREWMTTSDVCEDLTIDSKTLWTWRRRTEDPFPGPYEFGDNTQRYRRADVNAWIARRKRVELRRSSQADAA